MNVTIFGIKQGSRNQLNLHVFIERDSVFVLISYILSLTSLSNLLPWTNTRLKNVEAAIKVGIVGLQFKGADFLRHDLSQMGINFSTNEFHTSQNQSQITKEQGA